MKETARLCKLERLGTGEMTTEDELIMLRLIEGMHDPAFKHKLLETLQSVDLTEETCIEFVKQLINEVYKKVPFPEVFFTEVSKFILLNCSFKKAHI